MNVRWLMSWVVVLGIGCAHGPRTAQPEMPKYEHVFQKPLAEAMATARELLEAKGYTFEETQDPSQLLTTWEGPARPHTNADAYSRYLVTGIAVGPRQSVVRIFRMSFHTVSNTAEEGRYPWVKMLREMGYMRADPRLKPVQLDTNAPELDEMKLAAKGRRDLELEQALTLRLESGPSIEVVSGNIQQDPLPTPVRDEDFYLARWRDVDPKPGLCGDTVRGLSDLFQPGLTLLIGEQLGSREAPAVVGNVVCQMAEAGLPVVLGLSIPRTEQERLDRYLASPGAPVDQDALLEGRFWQRPYQDGRSSRAIFDLIDRVRAMRAAGLRVTLVAYDTDVAHGSERDAALAKVWTGRRAAHPDEVQVVLAGNTHTRTVSGTPWDQNFRPMAAHLDKGRVVVLEMSYAQGTRWGCDLNRAGKLQCGYLGATPSERVAATAGQTPYVQPFDSPTPEGFHGLLYVGELTPSLPAISKELTPPPPSGIRPAPSMVKHPPMF
ncbi:hypothetical protein HPC49_48825 [Pyxidicoccus fallax]|uniref:Lipoprotein n=1 Tax=Pyxidicoccus fallax TaxID=394095 RepID=A0A848LYM9_9BACT|nr:hypothetical protein [Pyxidicoccus fallax]NMO23217.1 hypothetical protein [Pyxidicoccus fallax]NPC86077.1 hypothetical protein [Pyxidicoccus fallax]